MGFWVTVTRGGQFINERACAEGVVKIGRLRSSQLCLRGELVARLHGVFEVEPQLRIIDLGAEQGVRVNGERVLNTTVGPGDVLGVADYELEITGPYAGDVGQEARLASAERCLARGDVALARDDLELLVVCLDAAATHVPDPELDGLTTQLREGFDLREPSDDRPQLPNTYDSADVWLDAAVGAKLDALRLALQPRLEAGGLISTSSRLELELLLAPGEAALTVYMDWLQARGDPRGELIALQRLHARTGLDAGGHARVDELLAAHGESWSRSFLDRGARVLAFRRGFPARVDTCEASAQQLGALGPYLRSVEAIEGDAAAALERSRHFALNLRDLL